MSPIHILQIKADAGRTNFANSPFLSAEVANTSFVPPDHRQTHVTFESSILKANMLNVTVYTPPRQCAYLEVC